MTHVETNPPKSVVVLPLSIRACLPVAVPGSYVTGIYTIAYMCEALTVCLLSAFPFFHLP